MMRIPTIENVTRRLSEISVSGTTTIAGIVVTRWTAGFEVETYSRKVPVPAETAAAQIIQLASTPPVPTVAQRVAANLVARRSTQPGTDARRFGAMPIQGERP